MADIRNDLRSAEYKNPGYVWDRIAPKLLVPQIAGNLYFQQLQADVTAQTGRDTAALAAITAHQVSANQYTYSCAEVRDREEMGYTQIKGYTDKLHAELVMARIAKRACYKQVETRLATALLAGATDLSASTTLVEDIENSVSLLMDVAPGKIALVVSSWLFTQLKALAEIKDRMKYTGVAIGAGGDPRNVTAEQLAAILGVSEVIVAPNDIWYTAQSTAALKKTGALVILPDNLATSDPAEELQWGRSVCFDWDTTADIFTLESFHDDNTDADAVDCKSMVDFHVFNAGMALPLQLIA